MRRLAWIAVALLALGACSDNHAGDDVHTAIRRKASKCCQLLVDGDIDAYLAHILDYENKPEAYRSQLRDMFEEYLDREQQQRGGLVSATVVGDTLQDSITADALVEILFGDSTCEQISIPMVKSEGEWYLK